MLEYSRSLPFRRDDGGVGLDLRLSRREGNIVEEYVDDIPGPEPATYCDLAFPAFMGASGAPAIGPSGNAVVGMIVQNRERELLPAQVLRVQTSADTTEETKYFLPLAKAIAFQALCQALAEAVNELE